ncbi:MAG: class I adenylate-forming enzyme family protein, partial [Lachnospiraceae bacterium]|nr:class I adenylate-forming enzyme family protein [Lachnospiraceae bacterium]
YPSVDKPQNKNISFIKKHPIIPNLSIADALEFMSLTYRNITAIECGALKLSYKEMIRCYKKLAVALSQLGIQKNDIVTISMNNYIQAVLSFFACNYIGAVVTFLNASASDDEIVDYLNLFNSPILINQNKSEKENENIKSQTGVRYIITLQSELIDSLCFDSENTYENEAFIDFNSLGHYMYGHARHCKNDNALILFTSGTTGKPKSVVLTNENVLAAGTYLKNSSNITSDKQDKRTLVCVPFSYPYGFVTSTIMSFLSGRTAILAPNISKDTISSYMMAKPNMIFGSPALLDLMMRNIPEDQDLSFIYTFISGGDFLTPQANERGRKFFLAHGATVELGNGSGNAETVSCGTNPVGIEIRPETAGKILAGTDAIIVNPETMEELTYGNEGLMCVSGKHVFKEYYNEPELTKQAKFVRNGKEYFKTGTIGYIDEDGYFTITGRQSRFYIMSSLNKVYCDLVQRAISMIDIVNDCAVVTVPDQDLLYVNKAYIVLTDTDMDDTEAKQYIMSRCNETLEDDYGNVVQLKPYEIPTYIEFIKSMPRKMGTEKVDYDWLEQDAIKKTKNR